MFHILTVADCHGHLTMKTAKEYADRLSVIPDVIAFLGDNTCEDIEIINSLFPATEKIGVLGNHDERMQFEKLYEEYGIKNIHGKVIGIKGILIGGMEGCIRYKDETAYPMYSQTQYKEMMKKMPRCDVLLTHGNPYIPHICFKHEAHEGIRAFYSYVKKRNVGLHIYGHLHEYQTHYIKKCRCVCTYGLAIQSYRK